MLRAGASARVSVFVVFVDVRSVAVVIKFVKIAIISAGTRDIKSDLGVAALPLRRRAIRLLIRRDTKALGGYRRTPSRVATKVATRVAKKLGRVTRLGRVS